MHHDRHSTAAPIYNSSSWTPPIQYYHPAMSLQLPPVRDFLSRNRRSVLDNVNLAHAYPPLVLRPQHNQDYLTHPRHFDRHPNQHSLRGLVDISNPLSLTHNLPHVTRHLISEPEHLASHEKQRAPPTDKKRSRHRSFTICDSPTRHVPIRTSSDAPRPPPGDKEVMLRYYTESVKPRKKRIRKCSTSGTLEDYTAFMRDPTNREVTDKVPKKDSIMMLSGFQRLRLLGEQITQSMNLREPISVCAEQDIHFGQFETPALDYDSDGPPPLIIDLPEDSSSPVGSPTENNNDVTNLKSGPAFDVPTDRPLTNLTKPTVPSECCEKECPPSYFSPVQKELLSTTCPQSLSTTTPSILSGACPSTSVTTPTTVSTTPVSPRTVTAYAPVVSPAKGGKFQCRRCHSYFLSVNLLLSHRSSCQVKSASSEYQSCAQCNKTFTSSKACSDHWKEYHSSERPHLCSECGRRFTLARALEKHSWTHT